MTRTIFALALAVALTAGLAGCGKKGALEEPGKAEDDTRPRWYEPRF